MSLYQRFDEMLSRSLKLRAVWLPGDPVSVGDVMVRRDDQFFQAANLEDFGVTPRLRPHTAKQINLRSSGMRERIFQFDAEIGKDDLDLSAKAQVKLEFTSKFDFSVSTDKLAGQHISNMLIVARQLKDDPNWRHDKFFIVEETFGASQWSFVGSEESGQALEFSGTGDGILKFLDVGAKGNLTKSGSVALELLGASGELGMSLVRIRENGTLNHGD